jgi:hypothetical protein
MPAATPPPTFKLDDLALMSRAKNYFAWQARLVKPWLGQRVLEAGCVGYIASMAGRRVVYYGRTGDNHVEWFPGAT